MAKVNKPIKEIKCPKCKKKMIVHGNMDNDYYYCENIKCEFCGLERVIYPWEKD